MQIYERQTQDPAILQAGNVRREIARQNWILYQPLDLERHESYRSHYFTLISADVSRAVEQEAVGIAADLAAASAGKTLPNNWAVEEF